MQKNAILDLLTTAEAAEYLRIKERKLYELVAEGAVPCTKVTGKWLFPRPELDRWLLAGMSRPAGTVPASPPPIVGGSHDPLLQWALNQSKAELALLPEGSATGYQRFLAGSVIAASIHFHDAPGPDDDANVFVVSGQPRLYDSVLIAFCKREQGILVAPGNPMKLRSLTDVAVRKVRLAMRPDGAGAQQLLRSLLVREGLTLADVVHGPVAPTGPDIAQAIRAGHADCGLATRAVANASGVDFVPVTIEHFDLIMRQRDSYRPALQKLISFMRSPAFQARANELGGLDVSNAGSVRWAP